jgi:hypothetical protein
MSSKTLRRLKLMAESRLLLSSRKILRIVTTFSRPNTKHTKSSIRAVPIKARLLRLLLNAGMPAPNSGTISTNPKIPQGEIRSNF